MMSILHGRLSSRPGAWYARRQLIGGRSLPSALRYSVDLRRVDEGAPSRPLLAVPADLGRPIRSGVINNPLSFRNRRSRTLAAVRDVLVAPARIPHYEVDRPEDIGAATREGREAGSESIVLTGGDGTVQAVLAALFSADVEGLPLLAVLPSGTTNMVAADIGGTKRPLQALEQLLTGVDSGRLRGSVVERPVM